MLIDTETEQFQFESTEFAVSMHGTQIRGSRSVHAFDQESATRFVQYNGGRLKDPSLKFFCGICEVIEREHQEQHGPHLYLTKSTNADIVLVTEVGIPLRYVAPEVFQ